MLAVGADPGSKFEAVSVVGSKDTVLNIMLEAVDWVKLSPLISGVIFNRIQCLYLAYEVIYSN